MGAGAQPPVVSDNPARHRFEATLDGQLAGHAEYVRSGTLLDFTHTSVGHEFEGRGVASALIRAALDTVRERGEQALPHCPFVRAYIQQHREYADLVPAGRRADFGIEREG